MAGARVLVMDDDPDGSRVLTTVLAAAGFDAATACDERTAARAVLHEDVAVVVSSFAASGIASTTRLVGQLRRRAEPQLADAGVVALVDDERDGALGLTSAADRVLVRPVAAQVLIDAVTEVAATSVSGRRARRAVGASTASLEGGHRMVGHVDCADPAAPLRAVVDLRDADAAQGRVQSGSFSA